MQMANKPHVVVVPFPAQGHIMPLMKLSCCLVDHGLKVTFVVTDSIHAKLLDAMPGKGKELASVDIDMVAVPDGLSTEQRINPMSILFSSTETLEEELEKLFRKIMQSSTTEKIACVIADETLACALEVAMKMKIRAACFFPSSASVKALLYSIPKLIDMDVIDDNGYLKKDETIQLSATMPAIKATHLTWSLADPHVQEKFFGIMSKNGQVAGLTNWVMCNSSDELEHTALSLVPNLLPIGPLLASYQLGNLWLEDSTCMNWLDQQATSSVIYIAFGSIATLYQRQLDELACALELLGRPFLWVVRMDGTGELTAKLPNGFQERVAHLGKMVSWAPQQRVLAHPSVACFISHCGWNSTMDGVSIGVPFISWPCFSDQFSNGIYITDVWKVGLGVNPDEEEIVTRDEIKTKVGLLLGDEGIRANSLKLREIVRTCTAKGGSSYKNLEQFVEELKHRRQLSHNNFKCHRRI